MGAACSFTATRAFAELDGVVEAGPEGTLVGKVAQPDNSPTSDTRGNMMRRDVRKLGHPFFLDMNFSLSRRMNWLICDDKVQQMACQGFPPWSSEEYGTSGATSPRSSRLKWNLTINLLLSVLY